MEATKYAEVNESRCIACGACAKICPNGAVDILRGCFAKIEKEYCTGCGLCAGECPAKCIDIIERKNL